jgi:hypothetical protein
VFEKTRARVMFVLTRAGIICGFSRKSCYLTPEICADQLFLVGGIWFALLFFRFRASNFEGRAIK